MATNWDSADVMCPYYRGMEVRNAKVYVACEAIPPAANMMIFFPSWEARDKYMDAYCKTDRYWACATCETLDAMLYRQEEGER